MERFLYLNQRVVGEEGLPVVLGVHDDPLHATDLLGGLVVSTIVGPHYHFVVNRMTDGTHAMTSCQNLKKIKRLGYAKRMTC